MAVWIHDRNRYKENNLVGERVAELNQLYRVVAAYFLVSVHVECCSPFSQNYLTLTKCLLR